MTNKDKSESFKPGAYFFFYFLYFSFYMLNTLIIKNI